MDVVVVVVVVVAMTIIVTMIFPNAGSKVVALILRTKKAPDSVSVRRPIFTETVCGFPLSLQTNARIGPATNNLFSS